MSESTEILVEKTDKPEKKSWLLGFLNKVWLLFKFGIFMIGLSTVMVLGLNQVSTPVTEPQQEEAIKMPAKYNQWVESILQTKQYSTKMKSTLYIPQEKTGLGTWSGVICYITRDYNGTEVKCEKNNFTSADVWAYVTYEEDDVIHFSE